ncbi:MAG: SAP domain-containing protein [Gallionellales bacterium RIFCSPLOWO2_02_FULL_57_47]|nr:MAG: SAP domain-containing protein [Gallionellales bacterium RIFCSPLOWO2_02_FULL_57_47]OGT10757.1 MAG: SAP domain-containing protein [Gallionellales bacterium RIFCSPHIGHO2_02_FULL_57_16]
MKLEEVRTIAKSHSIKPGNLSKTGLIKMIQTAEGSFDCYATARSGECDQVNCNWREDCFEASTQ